jgi:hypothetical protein
METERMIIKSDQKMASQIDEEIAKFADSGRAALLLGKISYPNNAGGVASRRDSVGRLSWGVGIDGQALEDSTVE